MHATFSHYIREMLSACSSQARLLEAKSLLSTSHLGRMSSRPNVGRRRRNRRHLIKTKEPRPDCRPPPSPTSSSVITLAVAQQQQPVLKPIIKTRSGRSVKPPVPLADYVASWRGGVMSAVQWPDHTVHCDHRSPLGQLCNLHNLHTVWTMDQSCHLVY